VRIGWCERVRKGILTVGGSTSDKFNQRGTEPTKSYPFSLHGALIPFGFGWELGIGWDTSTLTLSDGSCPFSIISHRERTLMTESPGTGTWKPPRHQIDQFKPTLVTNNPHRSIVPSTKYKYNSWEDSEGLDQSKVPAGSPVGCAARSLALSGRGVIVYFVPSYNGPWCSC